VEYPHHIHTVGSSDPAILADPVSQKYYLFSSGIFFTDAPRTRVPGTITCIVSEDLIHWSDPVTVFDCRGTDFWGPNGYPATECHYYNGKYYLFGSASAPGIIRGTMILVADNPLGPYTWMENRPVSPRSWQTLDSTLYVDRQGKPWLVYVHEWVQVSDGQIACQPLSDDLSHTIGDPMILFRASDAIWSDDQIYSKTDGGGVTDGPWLHRMQNGSLIMLWTTRSRLGYAMGYAKSMSGEIWGPWVQMDRPLYGHDGGHSMMFRKLDDGKLILSQHVADRGPKMVTLFEMEEIGSDLHIVNEITGNWAHTIGGNAEKYKYDIPIQTEPAFTTLAPTGMAAYWAERMGSYRPFAKAEHAQEGEE